jgi:hypothetical protein
MSIHARWRFFLSLSRSVELFYKYRVVFQFPIFLDILWNHSLEPQICGLHNPSVMESDLEELTVEASVTPRMKILRSNDVVLPSHADSGRSVSNEMFLPPEVASETQTRIPLFVPCNHLGIVLYVAQSAVISHLNPPLKDVVELKESDESETSPFLQE